MPHKVRLTSVDVLRDVKAALVEFIEESRRILAEADSDIGRTIGWLETEARIYWQQQMRTRREKLNEARMALSQARVSPRGERKDDVAERKAVERAERRLAEAEQKLAATKRWARELQREQAYYKAYAQQLSVMIEHDLPYSVAILDKLMEHVDRYLREPSPEMQEKLERVMGMMELESPPADSAARAKPDVENVHNPDQIAAPVVPTQVERMSAKPARVGSLQIALPQLRSDALRHVESLGPAGASPAPDQHVAVKATSDERCWLVRGRPTGPSDSGWSVVSADATAGTPTVRLTISELLSESPTLEPALSMAESAAILLEAGRVVAVQRGNGDITMVERR